MSDAKKACWGNFSCGQFSLTGYFPWHFPGISLTAVKFSDISLFSLLVVTLLSGRGRGIKDNLPGPALSLYIDHWPQTLLWLILYSLRGCKFWWEWRRLWPDQSPPAWCCHWCQEEGSGVWGRGVRYGDSDRTWCLAAAGRYSSIRPTPHTHYMHSHISRLFSQWVIYSVGNLFGWSYVR